MEKLALDDMKRSMAQEKRQWTERLERTRLVHAAELDAAKALADEAKTHEQRARAEAKELVEDAENRLERLLAEQRVGARGCRVDGCKEVGGANGQAHVERVGDVELQVGAHVRLGY